MINHLSHDIGWTTTIMALAVLLVCLPALFAWGTWEIRRYGRALRAARIIDAPDHRFRTPAAARVPRGLAAVSPAILDDPFVKSTDYALDAIDAAFATSKPSNVVSLDRWSVGA